MIPKAGKPGKFRPLGIPTIADRVVQSAVKQVLEPLLEARFEHVSYGFRPGKGCHGALEHIRTAIRPRGKNPENGKRDQMPYQWVIEADIQGCFDNIDHHLLMERVRKHSCDRRVNQLLVKFLKAGILSEEQFLRTETGTPQGGIISPLLANTALGIVEERYERWVNHKSKLRQTRKCDGITAAMRSRATDRKAGRKVFFPIRYADDFVTLISGSELDAQQEKGELETILKTGMGPTLSAEKTKVTPLTQGFQFLGYRVSMRWDERYGWTPRIEIPKEKLADLKYKVKYLTGRSTIKWSLSELLQKLNPILRGWANFYHYCTGAKKILTSLDWYTRDRVWRWLRKKYPKANAEMILRHRKASKARPTCKVWSTDGIELYQTGRLKVMRYRRGWMIPPNSPRFLASRMRTERRTSGSARRQAKPMIERSNWRACLILPYMPLKGGKWAYLCVWMDLFSRQVVGWQLGDNMQEALVREPLESALLRRRVKSGMIVHSDRGGQYLSHKMKKLLKAFKLKQSMSRADDPYDNAWAESFWSRLKAELNMPKGGYESLEKLKTVLFEYIDGYYNTRRLHSSLNYLNPVAFEAQYYRQTG